MTTQIQNQVHNLSLEDKIELVQELWDEIVDESKLDSLPLEHQKILESRIHKINTGNATFKSWSELKSKNQVNNEI